MRIAAILMSASLCLAGCDGPGSHTPRADVGPGPKLLDPLLPGELFAQICLQEYPEIQAAKDKAVAFGFTPNSNSGTYFNNRSNISVKIRDAECSLVFGTEKKPEDILPRLAQGTANFVTDLPPGISVTSQVAGNGLSYFRMGIPGRG